jgi:Mn2+/Fe2+ NRAMP family transporter
MIVAATAIGTSHIILSPVAGARFGYGLIWLVLFAHLFKYPAFEFGPRFAIANRVSLIRGFQDVPGPKNWALWVFLGTTTLQGLTIFAAVISVTASIMLVSLGGLSYPAWIVLLGFLIIILHRTGKYPALALGSKLALGVLVVVSVIAFAAAPPRPSEWAQMLIPGLPAGSVLLAAAIFGLMPTGINVAIWHSLWAVEHLEEWEKTAKDKREMLELGMTDLRVGYWLSAILAVVFVSLGANLLQPRGLTPNGIDVALTLSKIYTELLGDWMFPVFMLASFAAMFSTSYSVMDGFPRTFASLVRTLFPSNRFLHKSVNPAYWIFMVVIFAFAVAVNTLVPNPVLMVTLVGVVSLLVAPVLYALNYYCVTRLIPDESMRPSRAMRIWALAGILIMTFAVVFSLYSRME